MCEKQATRYDDSHGPIVLCYQLFEAGYVTTGVDYDDDMEMYYLSLKHSSNTNVTTVNVICRDDVESILALEKIMRAKPLE